MKTSSKKTKNNKLVNFVRKIYYNNENIFLILLENRIIFTICLLFFIYFLFNKKKLIENLNLGKIEKNIKKQDKSSEEGGKKSDNFLTLATS